MATMNVCATDKSPDKLGRVQFTRQQWEYLETVFPEPVELGLSDLQIRERLGQRSVIHHVRSRVGTQREFDIY